MHIQPDENILETLGILGLHGNMADPNERTTTGASKFEEMVEKVNMIREKGFMA